jgi:hypothetical protein
MHRFETLFFCLRNSRSNRKTTSHRKLPHHLQTLILCLLAVSPALAQTPAATSTVLNVSSNSTAVTTIPAGTIGTLTATVSAGQVQLSHGRVIFCDTAVSSLCSDVHKIATAQVTSAGIATLNFFPGAGTHNYVAQYVGINGYAPSTSSVQTLTVTASHLSQITLSAALPNQPNQVSPSSLGTSVSVLGGALSPTGTVSLIDLTDSLTLGTLPIGPAATTLNLSHVSSPPTLGHEPSNIVIADFNGDGKPDMAIPNPGSPGDSIEGGPLTIVLGNGDGTFNAGPIPTTTVNPSVIAVADFNSDGKPDLAVDGGAGGTLQILLGNGNGSFTPAPASTPTVTPFTMTVADFNGDGKPDLAITSYTLAGSLNPLTILLGNGDGTFTAAAAPSGSNVYATIAGDFNGDGKADLAVLSGAYPDPATLLILLGNGDGSFAAQANSLPVSANSQSLFQSIVIGDFNGDGKVDLAVSSTYPDAVTEYQNLQVGVFLGNGDGSFSTAAPFQTKDDTYAFSIKAGDFNADGNTDIAFVDDVQTGILLSNGDGTFTLSAVVPESPTIDPDVDTVAIADFDGDGVPDVAQADSDLQTITVYLAVRSSISNNFFNNIAIPGASSATHNIKALYNGDVSFLGSGSNTIQVKSSPIAPALTVASSANSAVYGAQVVLTATLAPYSFSTLTTNGEGITFLSGGVTIGNGVLSSGVATLNTTSLPLGADSITAAYGGDANFAPVTSPATPVTVANPAPIVALNPSSLTFASQTIGTTSAAQIVTLTNSGQLPLTLTSIAASGDFAQTNTCGTSVAVGAHCSISVTFTPTAGGSRGGVITITDNAAGSPQTVTLTGAASGLSFTPTAPSLNIGTPGGNASTTILLSALNNFSGAVNLTCAVTYQGTGTPTDLPTCSITPTQANLTPATPVTATLTISTTAVTASATHARPWNRSSSSTGIAFAALLFLGLVPRRRWRGALLFSVLGLAVLGGVLGCNGGSSPPSSPTGPTSNPGTTTGTYNVVATATSGSATMSTTIPLTLQ